MGSKKVSETYKVLVICDNCGYVGVAELVKGIPIFDGECPKCGCESLSRNEQPRHYYNSDFLFLWR